MCIRDRCLPKLGVAEVWSEPHKGFKEPFLFIAANLGHNGRNGGIRSQQNSNQQRVCFAETVPFLIPVSYTHLRAHETPEHLVCRLLLEKKKTKTTHIHDPM
eukprot:TRINITY_DN39101_c0_g1_i4.p1 TRINITY_DN39101_c0_g1~~TRINITY_DN39101_c0_g1_i4.p1  ORF type:complete len:102 (+),score=18.90 TRINITY_DN39101_c0_g1_i4:97-402(+)